ncbi:hypothetical protein ACFE04_014463 [Oxalis oulophora]
MALSEAFYEALDGSEATTPFLEAGFLSKLSFWWLNPLMRKGKEKILEDDDVPNIRSSDTAYTCYSTYTEELRKHQGKGLLSIILSCHSKPLLISGFFALVKVLTLSVGPLLLPAFIHQRELLLSEGYALTGILFLVKILESLSERQWHFRTRLIGLQVKSTISALVYQKQQRLSNDAKLNHSQGEIVNYVTLDAHRIGELPYWFHQIWSTILLICLALAIIYYSVGLAIFAALITITMTVFASSPLAKSLHKYQRNLMVAQDNRVKAIIEALTNMKVLKLNAWETHFKNGIENLRAEEFQWIYAILSQYGYHVVLVWSAPILVPAITFWACYLLAVPLNASNVFVFLASLRIVQDQIRLLPDVVGAVIEAKTSLARIGKFLDAPELQFRNIRQKCNGLELKHSVLIRAAEISWNIDSSANATLWNINLVVQPGEKVAICGEVGSGKTTLLAALLGEVPRIDGTVEVYGKIGYVSQNAWIQTGTIRENILFGSNMDSIRYQKVLEKCSLLKDLEMLPFGDLTEIGERGVNLSGGQKQRVQLARALYQDADVYLLDDPLSAVDAHTATDLFKEYVMGELSGKTVILVTHQVDFLPTFDNILLISTGRILRSGAYDELMASCQEFQDLVNSHKKTAGSDTHADSSSRKRYVTFKEEVQKIDLKEKSTSCVEHQLIMQEERERGNAGLKLYLKYLSYNKGFLYFSMAIIFHAICLVGQLLQNYWLAAELENSQMSKLKLLTVYTAIVFVLAVTLLCRSISTVVLGCRASQSIFSTLLSSLFDAPLSFYDSTPLGRILSRVSSDLIVVDLELAFKLTIAVASALNAYSCFVLLAVLTWPVLFVILPMVYLGLVMQEQLGFAYELQVYYFSSAKELMRMNGTTKSLLASHLAESIDGAITIRAFEKEDHFFSKNLNLIDKNASKVFHSFSANEWLIQRLEIICAIVLSSSALAMTMLSLGASAPGLIGFGLSYGLSLNALLTFSVQFQTMLANSIVSVERLEQFMHIPGEAPALTESNLAPLNWPRFGRIEIINLKVRYRPNAPLVLRGISCIIEGGQKIGIVGRTGSGKTTLINSLFRLVEPQDGKIVIDDLDISFIGLQHLRSRLAIIPQDPTLFSGTVRYNLDPLSQHTDQEIWEVIGKCQLREAILMKPEGLNATVVKDGSNWSMGQRQLFCLGRAMLKKSRILVLDEATASIDNATDYILQKTIRREFSDNTVITVAHRIPTVMDCTKVVAISNGKLVEFDEPSKLIKTQGSLFGQLVEEYWSRSSETSMIY